MQTFNVKGNMLVQFETTVQAIDAEEAEALAQAKAFDMQAEYEPAEEMFDVEVTEIYKEMNAESWS
jgi:hypothetical protein